jgi:hypothetical protein
MSKGFVAALPTYEHPRGSRPESIGGPSRLPKRNRGRGANATTPAMDSFWETADA